ncbi:uncharacterized protein VTP21DRAFT_4036 [Calcarisporiella thermophila]|uniref:uncharacterized protein n=1 Tax=Calcarisporiella thermophila TaxID=911321 RepID=UPI003743C342
MKFSLLCILALTALVAANNDAFDRRDIKIGKDNTVGGSQQIGSNNQNNNLNSNTDSGSLNQNIDEE